MTLLRALFAEYGAVRIFAVVGVVLIVATLVIAAILRFWPPSPTEVPNLSDLTLESAKGRYEDDFGIKVRDRKPSEEPADSILTQEPEAGERVERGTEIEVVLSAGPPEGASMEVPDLSDLTLESAKGRYEDDFGIKVRDRKPSEEPADSIISQDPQPDEQAEHGSPISVVVSDGPPGQTGLATTPSPSPEGGGAATTPLPGDGTGVPTMEVPDLSGLTLENAESQHEDMFDIEVLDRQPSEEPADSIISQDPQPDEQAEHGSPISVVVSDGPPEQTGLTTTPSPSPDFTKVIDETGRLSMEVPTEWNDLLRGLPWEQAGFIRSQKRLGPAITASPDIDSWRTSWNTPGVFFGASSALAETYPSNTVNEILRLRALDVSAVCTFDDSYLYDDGLYAGKTKVWKRCGGTNTSLEQIVALPENGSYVVVVEITVVSEAEYEARQHIIDTFRVTGQV